MLADVRRNKRIQEEEHPGNQQSRKRIKILVDIKILIKMLVEDYKKESNGWSKVEAIIVCSTQRKCYWTESSVLKNMKCLSNSRT